MPTAQIIQRCRPAEPEPGRVNQITWLERWLAFWAYYALTDSWVRDNAMDLALDKQTKRQGGLSWL